MIRFNALMERLLYDASLSGSQGLTAAQFERSVRSFYGEQEAGVATTEESDTVEDGDLFSEETPAACTTVDESLLFSVFGWLCKHRDIEVRKFVSTDVAGENDQSSDVPLSPVASALLGKRIFTTDDRMWQAIAGHGVDHARLPQKSFDILSVIAAHGPAGVLQPEVRRITGQDKRSVPKRTDGLAEKGYIVKDTVIGAGAKTSILILKRYAQEQNVVPSEQTNNLATSGKPTIYYNAWFDRIIQMLRENNNIIAMKDLRIHLGIQGSKRETKVLARCLRRLAAAGLLRQVIAKFYSRDGTAMKVGASDRERKIKALQLLREPTEEDRLTWQARYATDGMRLKEERDDIEDDELDDDNDNFSDLNRHTPADGGEIIDMEGEETVGVYDGEFVDVDDGQNTFTSSSSQVVPQWTPDLPLVNIIFNIIDSAGEAGIASPELASRLIGPFWARPLEEIMSRLTDVVAHSQPPHLQHLSIIRVSEVHLGKAGYKYRSRRNFEKAVETGEVGKEGKEAEILKDIRKKQRPIELDAWGFPPVISNELAKRRDRSTLQASTTITDRHSEAGELQIDSEAELVLDEDSVAPGASTAGPAVNTQSSPIQTKRQGRPRKKRNEKKQTKSAVKRHDKAVKELESYSNEVQLIAERRIAAELRLGKKRKPAEADLEDTENAPTKILRGENAADVTASQGDCASADKLPQDRIEQVKADILAQEKPGVYLNPPKARRQRLLDSTQRRGRPRRSFVIVVKTELLKDLAWFQEGTLPQNSPRQSFVPRSDIDIPLDSLTPRGRKRKRTFPRESEHANESPTVAEPITLNGYASTVAYNPTNEHSSLPTAALKSEIQDNEARASKWRRGSAYRSQQEKGVLVRPESELVPCLTTEAVFGISDLSPPSNCEYYLSERVQEDNARGTLPRPGEDLSATQFAQAERAASLDPETVLRISSSSAPPVTSQEEGARADPQQTASGAALVTNNSQLATASTNPPDSGWLLLELQQQLKALRSRPGRKSKATLTKIAELEAHIAIHTSVSSTNAQSVAASGSHNAVSSVPDPHRRSSNKVVSRDGDILETLDKAFVLAHPHEVFHHRGGGRWVRGPRVSAQTEPNAIVDLIPSSLNATSADSTLFEISGQQSCAQGSVDIGETSQQEVSPDHRLPTLPTDTIFNSQIGISKTLGSAAAQRQQIVVDVVRSCNGVFPGNQEILCACAPVWKKAFDSIPDQKTIEKVIKNSVENKKLKRITFQFFSANGLLIRRHILLEPWVDAYSDAVTEMRKMIIGAFPQPYFPPQLELDQALLGKIGVPGVDTSSVTAPTPAPLWTAGDIPIVQQTSESTVYEDREAKEMGFSTAEEYRIHLRTRNLHGRRTQPRITEYDSDDEFVSPEQAARQTEFQIDNYQHDPTAIMKRTSARSRLSQNIQLEATPISLYSSQSSWKAARNAAPQEVPMDRHHAAALMLCPSQDYHAATGTYGTTGTIKSPFFNELKRHRNRRMRLDRIIESSTGILGANDSSQDPNTTYLLSTALPSEHQKRDRGRAQLKQVVTTEEWSKILQSDEETLKRARNRLSQRRYREKKLLKEGRLFGAYQRLSNRVNEAGQYGILNVDHRFSDAEHGVFERSSITTDNNNSDEDDGVSIGSERTDSGNEEQDPGNNALPQGEFDASETANATPGQAVSATVQTKRKYKSRTTRRMQSEGGASGNEHVPWTAKIQDGVDKEITHRDRKTTAAFQDVGQLVTAIAVVSLVTGGVNQHWTNWNIISHALSFHWDGDFLRRRWIHYRHNNATDMLRLQDSLREPFLKAYENGELPRIDFKNLNATDWPALVEWADQFKAPAKSTDSGFTSSLDVASRDELERQYVVEEQLPVWELSKDDFFTGHTDLSRRHVALQTVYGTTVDGRNKPSEPTHNDLLLKSWARAIAVTKQTEFHPAAATSKLTASFGPADFERVNESMVEQRLLTREKTLMPGRNFHIHNDVLTQFRRWPAKPEEHSYLRAVAKAWFRINQHFRLNDELALIPAASDPEYLVLTNLVGQGLVKLSVKLPERKDNIDAPYPKLSPWGYAGYGYEMKKVDMRQLKFPLTYHKTTNYSTRHGLRTGVPIPREPAPVEGESGARTPFWIDIHGNLLDDIWDMVLRSVLHLLVFRPGLTARNMERAHNHKLWEWEISLLLEWLNQVGIAERCETATSSDNGWRAGEWWYCAFAPDIATWRAPYGEDTDAS